MIMVSSLNKRYWLSVNISEDGLGVLVKTKDGVFYMPNDVALRLANVLIAKEELRYYQNNKD